MSPLTSRPCSSLLSCPLTEPGRPPCLVRHRGAILGNILNPASGDRAPISRQGIGSAGGSAYTDTDFPPSLPGFLRVKFLENKTFWETFSVCRDLARSFDLWTLHKYDHRPRNVTLSSKYNTKLENYLELGDNSIT